MLFLASPLFLIPQEQSSRIWHFLTSHSCLCHFISFSLRHLVRVFFFFFNNWSLSTSIWYSLPLLNVLRILLLFLMPFPLDFPTTSSNYHVPKKRFALIGNHAGRVLFAPRRVGCSIWVSYVKYSRYSCCTFSCFNIYSIHCNLKSQ